MVGLAREWTRGGERARGWEERGESLCEGQCDLGDGKRRTHPSPYHITNLSGPTLTLGRASTRSVGWGGVQAAHAAAPSLLMLLRLPATRLVRAAARRSGSSGSNSSREGGAQQGGRRAAVAARAACFAAGGGGGQMAASGAADPAAAAAAAAVGAGALGVGVGERALSDVLAAIQGGGQRGGQAVVYTVGGGAQVGCCWMIVEAHVPCPREACAPALTCVHSALRCRQDRRMPPCAVHHPHAHARALAHSVACMGPVHAPPCTIARTRRRTRGSWPPLAQVRAC